MSAFPIGSIKNLSYIFFIKIWPILTLLSERYALCYYENQRSVPCMHAPQPFFSIDKLLFI